MIKMLSNRGVKNTGVRPRLDRGYDKICMELESNRSMKNQIVQMIFFLGIGMFPSYGKFLFS